MIIISMLTMGCVSHYGAFGNIYMDNNHPKSK